MPKKLLRGPKIYFESDGGWDHDENDDVDGSGHGGFKLSYEGWKASEYCDDFNDDGIMNEADYLIWWFDEMEFDGDPYRDDGSIVEP